MRKQVTKTRWYLGLAVAGVFALPLSAIADDYQKNNRRSDSEARDRMTEDQRRSNTTNMESRNDENDRRFRMKPNTGVNLTSETQNDIREVLAAVVKQAASGDIEDTVDYLAEVDRDRLDGQELDSTSNLDRSSESFKSAWRDLHNNSFENDFNKDTLRVEFIDGERDRSARVRVSDGNDSVVLQVENQGTIMDQWKIDAPNSLTKAQLAQHVNRALTDGASHSDANKIALQILKPFGSDSMG